MNPYLLQRALDLLTCRLTLMLHSVLPQDYDRVILSPLVFPDGSVPDVIQDRLVLTMVNVEQDSVLRNLPPVTQDASTPAPMAVSVHILFAANFQDYASGLVVISSLMAFFQKNPVFSAANTPDLDPAIDVLRMDWVQLSHADICNIWTALGARYRPSFVYKMRIISHASETCINEVTATISTVQE